MTTQGVDTFLYNKELLPSALPFRFGIVVSEWNSSITNPLYEGCRATLKTFGAIDENIIHWSVPGSFELIFGAKKMMQKHVDAVIVIGSVIRGETSHFDYVCQSVSSGIKDLNIKGLIPVIFCVLTDNTLQQAKDRSGGKYGNKGVESAVTALKMISISQLK